MENELIKRAKLGDISAFEKLLLSHQNLIYNISLKITNNQNDAMDVSQEAMIKIYKSLHKFDGKSKFSTWIYRVAYNTALDFLRRQKNSINQISINQMYDDNENSVLELIDTNLNPEEKLLEKERIEAINNAINSLPNSPKIAIILRDVYGLSYEEISRILNCSLGTVKSRINRGRTRLKEILKQQNLFENRLTNYKGENHNE